MRRLSVISSNERNELAVKKKGYVLVELHQGASERDVVKRVRDDYLTDRDYCCSVVGKFDLVIEKNFEELHEVDRFVTQLRNDASISPSLAKTMTFIGTQQPA